MDFEEYSRRKERGKRQYTTNFIDRDTGLYITGMVWAGYIEPENIQLIQQEDLEWLES